MGVWPAREAGIVELRNVVALGQRLGDGLCVGGVALDAQGQRAHATEGQEAIHRPGHGTNGVLQEL
jgi:hypothetical protein